MRAWTLVACLECLTCLSACATETGERYVGERKAIGPDTTDYPADCLGLDEAMAYRCAEQRFWRSFRDHRDRPETYVFMQDVLDRFTEEVSDPEGRALLLFRRGQLANALMTEDGHPITILDEAAEDFRASLTLHENPKVWPWLEAIELPFALFANEPERAEEIFQQALEHIELMPTANILSIAGVAMAMPLDTDIPRRMLEQLERWECDGYEWCERNTWRAPWSQPGLEFMFAEAYARMGMRPQTVERLIRARQAEGYADWPYAEVVEAALADTDAWIASFTSIRSDLPVFEPAALTAEYSCLLCHRAD
ncbi:MAG: hypothetical protein KF901_26465 [Myxococcales bacterium]|nr:hypothetical protein [Myxococcales bacterium]